MQYGTFVSALVAGYEHRGGLKTMRLGRVEPEWFAAIQRECAWIYANAGSSDVTDKGHVTNWTRPSGQVRQFSLFNSTGNSDDTAGDFGYLGDVSKKHLVFAECQAIARFAALFGTSLRNLRLNGMGLGASLSHHEEHSITPTSRGVQHILRFHLPVFTNPQATMFLDGEAFFYGEGELFFFNHGCVHAAANDGDAPRYHLVLDCFLDRNLFARLFPGSPSPDAGFAKYSEAEARMAGQPAEVASFVSEGGRVRTGPLDYGRRAPTALAYYRKNYPSVFRFLPAHAD